MGKRREFLAVGLGLAIVVSGCLGPIETRPISTSASVEAEPGNVVVLSFSKPKFTDDEAQKERARFAANFVSGAIAQWNPSSRITQIDENPLTLAEASVNPEQVLISKAKLRERFAGLVRQVKEQDTFVLYSHSHGIKGSAEAQGGLYINETLRDGKPFGEKLTWAEYADLLLQIPAKNVLVFVMACYSGGLVDHLNSPGVREKWENRRAEGRNFIVISAQNAELLSGPVNIDGMLMNGLPFAVGEAFRAEAGDRRSSLGELAGFVLNTSRTRGSSGQYVNDSQMTGSYEPGWVLGF